jgi:hypothetical protein
MPHIENDEAKAYKPSTESVIVMGLSHRRGLNRFRIRRPNRSASALEMKLAPANRPSAAQFRPTFDFSIAAVTKDEYLI